MAGNNEGDVTGGDDQGLDLFDPTVPKRKRDKSRVRDELGSLGNAVIEMGERFERVEHSTTELENTVFTEIGGMKENLGGVDVQFIQLEEKVMEAIQTLRVSIEAMQEDLVLCKRAIANGGTSNGGAGRVDYPRPSRFDGARDAKEVENFLWQIEQYFDNLGLGDEMTKIKAATSYLTDTAMLLWRRRHRDIERGTCRMDTWEEFKKELKRQFYPENVVYEARRKLRELRQKGMIQDYVKEFTTLTLQIPNLSDQDLVFHFVDGLQGWAKQELQRRVATQELQITVAESLSDFHTQNQPETFKRKVVPRSGGEMREPQTRLTLRIKENVSYKRSMKPRSVPLFREAVVMYVKVHTLQGIAQNLGHYLRLSSKKRQMLVRRRGC